VADRSAAPREIFRLAPPLVLWWVWVVFAVANVADLAIQGTSARYAVVISAVLATITGVAYALAFRPRVIASPAGLVVRNPFRDHHVPWTAVQAVDCGDWVQVHYAATPDAPSSAASRAISCWALYVSARTKRRAARAELPPPRRLARRRPVTPSPFLPNAPSSGVFGEPGETSRLPDEAKYLASLPAARAIALQLDTRAKKERARARSGPVGPPASLVTGRWVWPSLAAVAVPALALLIVLLL
jgi:Bacterial PH domain